jgi:hypothetical protein
MDLRHLSEVVVEVGGWTMENTHTWGTMVQHRLQDWQVVNGVPRWTSLTCSSGTRRVEATLLGMDPEDPHNKEKNWLMARLVPEGWWYGFIYSCFLC